MESSSRYPGDRIVDGEGTPVHRLADAYDRLRTKKAQVEGIPKITFTERLENSAEVIAKTVDSIDSLIVEIREKLGVRMPPTSEAEPKNHYVPETGLLPRFDDYLDKLNARMSRVERDLAELRARL